MALQPPIHNEGGRHLIFEEGSKLTLKEGAVVEGLPNEGSSTPEEGSITEAMLNQALQNKLNDLQSRIETLEAADSSSGSGDDTSDSGSDSGTESGSEEASGSDS